MRALITGITGFAGQHLAHHLLAHGDIVSGTVWSVPNDVPVAAELRAASIPCFAWDLTAPATARLEQQIADFVPDCIFHLAALSVPADCGASEPTQAAWQTNVEGTRHVVALVQRLDPQPRLLFVSSSQVYAPISSPQSQVRETAQVAGHSGYARTKLAAEQIVAESAQRAGLDAVIVRAFKHTGPGQSSRMMVPEWASQFARGTNPVQIRTMDSWVDLCDVRDVVRAYRQLATLQPHAGLYNLGSGIRRRSGDIFLELRRIADPERPFRETAPQVRYEPIADTSLLQADTGWQPQIPLEQTLRDTLAYWRGQITP